MKHLRWQHWILIGVFSSMAYLFVIALVFAMKAE